MAGIACIYLLILDVYVRLAGYLRNTPQKRWTNSAAVAENIAMESRENGNASFDSRLNALRIYKKTGSEAEGAPDWPAYAL